MAEVVKSDVRPDFTERLSEQGPEGAVAEVEGVYEGSALRGEDEAARLV